MFEFLGECDATASPGRLCGCAVTASVDRCHRSLMISTFAPSKFERQTDRLTCSYAESPREDRMDPNIEFAAQAGDPAAMRMLGQAKLREGPDPELARDWLLAAAEAGDPDAMYDLAKTPHVLRGADGSKGRAELATYWLRRAAEAGSVAAMTSMAEGATSADEREFWLRRAIECGAWWAMCDLGELLEAEGREAEAEHWYRAGNAHRSLADLLISQGREKEAERCLTSAAEAGSWEAADVLAEIYARMGWRGEASWWRKESARMRTRPQYCMVSRFSEVALTAVVTTALVPFLQALTSKVAEDAYGQARQMVLRLLCRNPRNDEVAEPGLAIVQDPDKGITLFLWSNASDEALRALSSLDLGELTLRRPYQGQIHLVWHPASGTWRIRGSQ
ncbi:hypothetical protein AB0953_29840 [Streptomyces sp. NPDC046866]|uniref:tetratricopeptide repeat protein n=1 Tax=Streptomyces sp. NPDC046866 TaxID=3154921 RepID=UPI003454115B